jgi:phosphate acyltransferase
MKIAIDVMGGDYAPVEIIKGAVAGARTQGVGALLVGPQEIIQKELASYDTRGLDIEIVHTDEYLKEGEHPAYTLRQKRRASILLAVRQIKEGKAAAAVGAGPTGGVFASALQVLGTVEGIARPMIGSQMVGYAPDMIVVDLGGNVDNRPDQLLDFGIVGSVYARKWMGIENPTIALLSNGKEEGKGNEVVKQTYDLFKKSGLNFIGNVEGFDLPYGRANVVVCDGFVGNCVIKFFEGMVGTTSEWWKKKLTARYSAAEAEELLADYHKDIIPAHTLGGVLWGINGVVCKTHGHSRAADIAHEMGIAKKAVELDLIGSLRTEVEAVRSKIK